MLNNYAKVIVKGSPISKSNFKLFNMNGRAILPYKSGKYHDRYAVYEEQIALETRIQNPKTVLTESLIAVLHVYYKSKKRHPDTNNITKSIFDGIEKSGIIINDAQIRRLIIEEFYDPVNPRFELELFGESTFYMTYEIFQKEKPDEPIDYELPSNKKGEVFKNREVSEIFDKEIPSKDLSHCHVCGKSVTIGNCVSANKGKNKICKDCLKRMF
jgi:Holliday junction resolvase RusA-like endonuclease